MNSPFCPPLLFRASMTTARGDDDLPDGLHVRVWLNPSFGVPLCPFVVSPLHPDFKPIPIGDVVAFSEDGPTGFPIRPGANGPVTVILNPTVAAGFDPWICWVKLEGDPGDSLQLELLDFKGRLVGRRSQEPWAASGSNIAQIRIGGTGTVHRIWVFNPSPGARAPARGDDPALELSLPFDTAKWYAGLGESASYDRAIDGAPLRLPPQDDSGQPTIDDPGNAELARIKVVADMIRPWLEDTFDQPDLPWSRLLRYDPDAGLKGKVEAPELAAIWATAADPGIARYLGFLGRIHAPLRDPEFPTQVWSVGCLLAVNPDDRESWRLAGMDDPESSVQSEMADYLRSRYDLSEVEQRASDNGLVTRAFMTAVAAAVPFDPPEVPGLAPGRSRWNAANGAEEWSEQLTAEGNPPPGPIAAWRTSDGVRLHRVIAGTDPERWAVLLAARDDNGAVSVNDLHVPPGPAEWTVWYSDEFGRWGQPSTKPANEPPRPGPPAPEVELSFVPGPVAGGNGPASPGSVRIAVNVPTKFEPGMLPLKWLDLTVDGSTDSKVPVSDVFSAPVPLTSPGGGTTVKVEATLWNDGGSGPAAKAELAVNDPRPPPTLTAAPALTWTSRGDGVGGAELALSWPHQPGAAAYRVYVADEQAISGAAVEDASRATRAKHLFTRAAQAARDTYRLVTDPAFPPPAGTPVGGLVHLPVPLPGGLTNVQFVKVLAVTAAWVEAPFDSSGAVPVAVPLPDVPPAPSLQVKANADGTTTVEIHARGIDPGLLARLGPSAPQYRLRSATGAVGAEYAHEVASGDLLPGAAGEWHVTVTTPGAAPFVETSWYAEVRYPAEPGVEGDPDLVLTNDRIRPTWSAPGEPMEMRWGPASLPVPSLFDPGPPAAPVATRRVEAGTTSIVVDPAPVAGPRAVGPFRLAAWRLVPGSEPALVAPVDTTPITATPFRLDDPVGAPAYRVAVVDPLGRWSDAVEVS